MAAWLVAVAADDPDRIDPEHFRFAQDEPQLFLRIPFSALGGTDGITDMGGEFDVVVIVLPSVPETAEPHDLPVPQPDRHVPRDLLLHGIAEPQPV